jgi:hypothetical protein
LQSSAGSDIYYLKDIAASIETYKGKTISLKLRLRNLDTIFERIIFYDPKNHDIEFDLSGRERRKRLAKSMQNIHEGMIYIVTFNVQGDASQGTISGELMNFYPVIVDIIPEGGPQLK